jgi:hypothetical protein
MCHNTNLAMFICVDIYSVNACISSGEADKIAITIDSGTHYEKKLHEV